MKRINIIIASLLAVISLSLSSCVKDLDVKPIDPNIALPEEVLDSQDAFAALLAKCYQGFSCSSSYGTSGSPDIQGVDGGFGQYVRALFNCQGLTTDEAICCWNDGTLQDLHNMCWNASCEFSNAMYYRIFYEISLANEFIRRANESQIEDFELKDEFIAEARAIRAFAYYHAIDMFGTVPFCTENDSVGSTGAAPISRAELFDWIVSECKALLEGTDLAEPKKNEYGRCDKGMVKMLLAKMYLNAEVWAGKKMYSECANLCREIKGDYPLHKVANGTAMSAFQELFCANNNTLTNNATYSGDEIIFTIMQDGEFVASYGATTYLLFGSCGEGMDPAELGISSGWGGLTVCGTLASKFDAADARNLFFTDYGLEITDPSDFTKGGYKSVKYTNILTDGSSYVNPGFANADFPVFRSADAYLMLAECAVRGAAPESEGLAALNEVRERAGIAKLQASQFNAQSVLDERAREFLFECCRRQDLIRFGQFTTDAYLWDYKGSVKAGKAVDEKYNLFPIPASELNCNGKLQQNPGY